MKKGIITNNVIETTGKSISSNNNSNPKTLYKYTSMDFIESCILNGVYASPIDAVNDPFECDGITYPNLYRICCMTNSPRQMLLWAYYTNHKECCVEFDVSNIDPTILRKVQYIESFSSHSDMSLGEVYQSLYCKGKEWQHENEYRAVYYKNDYNSSVWNIIGNNVYLNVKVKSVMFGLYADKDLPRYKSALETLKRYNIEGRKCKLKNNKYEIEDDRQFDVDAELERINTRLNRGKKEQDVLIISAEEERTLRRFIKLQNASSDAITFGDVATDAEMLEGVQKLLKKHILAIDYEQERTGTFKFYYVLTELGKRYSLVLE